MPKFPGFNTPGDNIARMFGGVSAMVQYRHETVHVRLGRDVPRFPGYYTPGDDIANMITGYSSDVLAMVHW